MLEIGTLVRPRAGNPLTQGRLLKVCHCWGKGWEGEQLYEVTFPDSDVKGPHALIGPFKESELIKEV